MLPNLGGLAMPPADRNRPDENASTGMWGGLGRRTPREVERAGRWRKEIDHERKLLNRYKGDYDTWPAHALRHNWQYLRVRYRNEKTLPLENADSEKASYPNYVAKGTEEYQAYMEAQKRGEVVRDISPELALEGRPLLHDALHCEIVIDSPDVYEMETHSFHWWLLRWLASRQNYHGIDEQVYHDLFTVGIQAVAEMNSDEYRKLTRDGIASDKLHAYVERLVHAVSLHVGHDSYHGLSFYWRVEEEVYKYLATKKNMQLGETKKPDPRKFFEPFVYKLIFEQSGADMTCIQQRDVTNAIDTEFGSQVIEYRIRHRDAVDHPEDAPSCLDQWPLWQPLNKSELEGKDVAELIREQEEAQNRRPYSGDPPPPLPPAPSPSYV